MDRLDQGSVSVRNASLGALVGCLVALEVLFFISPGDTWVEMEHPIRPEPVGIVEYLLLAMIVVVFTTAAWLAGENRFLRATLVGSAFAFAFFVAGLAWGAVMSLDHKFIDETYEQLVERSRSEGIVLAAFSFIGGVAGLVWFLGRRRRASHKPV